MVDEMEPRSDDVVDQHEAALIARMKLNVRERRETRLVALVADADTGLAEALLDSPADLSRAADGSVAALITRESAKKFLGQMTPQLLDWLEDEGSGPNRKLPIIHLARHATRTMSVPYNLPE